MTQLSILIPARNEMFLARTVEDILENMRADTEILVALDGEWADPPLKQHERVNVLYLPESVGQRAATNMLAKLARGEWLMKVDAHCAFAPGFDEVLLEDIEPDMTMVPLMKNLHAFDWVCDECGHRRYQGPTPTSCPDCENTTDFTRDILWRAKPSPNSTAYRFDRDMKFQYWGGYKKRQEGDLVETLSLQGSCWMLHRDKYFELDICDEAHGGWGQQGTEVACKTWLSGGRVIVNKRTWYAHMFRTQGGDFGFPYPLSGSDVKKAREYSKDLWLNDNWDKAIYPLSWLLDKFAPVPEWHDKPDKPTKGIVYYTDNRLDEKYAAPVRRMITNTGLPIVSASLQPLDFGKNIHIDQERGYLTMFRQILAALEASEAEIIFFCEHDVLYHPTHFDFTPPRQDVFYYNQNVWKVHSEYGFGLFYRCNQTSGLCAYRELLLDHYRKRVAYVEEHGFSRRIGFEPGTHGRIPELKGKHETWMSEYPNIDIRHDKNLTPSRWKRSEFRNKKFCDGWLMKDTIPGWGKTLGRFDEILESV